MAMHYYRDNCSDCGQFRLLVEELGRICGDCYRRWGAKSVREKRNEFYFLFTIIVVCVALLVVVLAVCAPL
jgi:hypothetical protein